MITQVLHCPYCYGTDIVRHGTTSEGKQRYRCRECLLGRGRTFLVLHVSPTTVLKELKKRHLTSTR